jgi:hypothetical protein
LRLQDGLTEEEMAAKKKQFEQEREKRRQEAERNLKKQSREMKMSELESQKVKSMHEFINHPTVAAAAAVA